MHKPSLGSILVGLIPFLAMCLTVSLWDRVYPFVLGMPFNIFWLVAWIILTPVCMSFAYRMEQKADRCSGRRCPQWITAISP